MYGGDRGVVTGYSNWFYFWHFVGGQISESSGFYSFFSGFHGTGLRQNMEKMEVIVFVSILWTLPEGMCTKIPEHYAIKVWIKKHGRGNLLL